MREDQTTENLHSRYPPSQPANIPGKTTDPGEPFDLAVLWPAIEPVRKTPKQTIKPALAQAEPAPRGGGIARQFTEVPFRPNTPPPNRIAVTISEQKIPSLTVKLSGPTNYPAWLTSIKLTFRLARVGNKRVWELVEGTFKKPTSMEDATQEWQDGNDFALLTIFQNCEENVRTKIETCELASEAWKELKDTYECKTTYEGKSNTEFWALYEGLRKIKFNDRKETIEEHINNFEVNWNRFVRIMSSVDETSTTITGLGKGLKAFSRCDTTKADFLLSSLRSPVYVNMIEDIRASDYTYETVVQKLTEFVAMSGREPKSEGVETGKGKVKIDNGKRCDYCIAKGWKGLNHTENECFTKKREKKKPDLGSLFE